MIKNMLSFASALCFLVGPANAAADAVAYGYEIGSALTLPECPKTLTATGRASYGLGSVPFQCLKQVSPTAGPLDLNRPLFLVFPMTMTPANSSSDSLGALLIDGKLELLTVWTKGADFQDAVFDELVGKYGQPTTSTRAPITTGHGSPVGGIQATWDLGSDLEVVFSGVLGSMRQGLLLIGSKKGHAAQGERLKQSRTTGQTPL